MTDRSSTVRSPRSRCGCGSPALRCCGSGCGRRAGRRSRALGCVSGARRCSMSCRICRACLHAAILLGLGAAFAIGLGCGIPQDRHSRCLLPRAAASSRRAGCSTGRCRRSPIGRAGRSIRRRPGCGRRICGAWRRRRAGCGSGCRSAGFAAARSVGVARRAGDPAAARRDRCRERLAGSSRPGR